MNNSKLTGRRTFISAAGVALAATATELPARGALAAPVEASFESQSSGDARERAYSLRVNVAKRNREATPPNLQHRSNGDESRYPSKIGTFTKGLQHDDQGEVLASSYASLTNALRTSRPADFERIAIGGTSKLVNPQAGAALELEGADARSFVIPPAPAFASAEQAAELAENYWMALLRDVPFEAYPSNAIAADAARDLNRFGSEAKVPKFGGVVTPGLLFRGLTPGDAVGPYMSQFFYLPIAFGPNVLDQRVVTYATGVDFLTKFADYLAAQRGSAAATTTTAGAKVFISKGRDIGRWVHQDVLFQAYFHAVLALSGMGTPLNPGNPYRASRTQSGFGTLGDPQIDGLLGEVAQRALRAVWFQKWFVHRKVRPEAFAARAHLVLRGRANYPVNPMILDSLSSRSRLGGYLSGSGLLPMAYPEGCPVHPSYGAGHATVAGACVTLLKAWYDGTFVLPNPLQPTLDGSSVVPYTEAPLTVTGELDKLASNVAIGRNIAGVHWRSDATESLKLGQAVAIQCLRECKATLNEDVSFTFNDFDGNSVTV